MVQQVSALRKQLLDTALPLPLRFRVLFSLRAVNTDEAVDALLAGECPCARGRVLSRRTEGALLTAHVRGRRQVWATRPPCFAMKWPLRWVK